MPRNIPPRGSIPPNIREAKPAERKGIIEARNASVSDSYHIQGKPTAKKRLGKGTLEKLLTWGQREEQRCIHILRMLSPELPEYNEVLEKLGKLQKVLEQVKRQLAARE